MSHCRGAVFVPLDDYLDMNFTPQEESGPSTQVAKPRAETAYPATNNQQKGLNMSTRNSTCAPPTAFTAQWNPDPTPDRPDRETLGWAEGPEFHEHCLDLVALWHPDRGVKVHFEGSHEVDPQISVDDLPRLAAALLRYHSQLLEAMRRSDK